MICQEIFQWLKIDPSFTPRTEKEYNKTQKPKSEALSTLLIKLRQNNNPVKKLAKKILPYAAFTRLGNFLLEFNRSSKKFEPISREMKEYLYNYFEPYNKQLEEMTKINLDKWKLSSEKRT